MAVHDLGYRGWSGPRAARWTRSLVVAQTSVRRAWQSRWLRRMVLFAWLPSLWFAGGFFMFEQAVLHPQWRRSVRPFLEGAPRTEQLAQIMDGVVDDEAAARHTMWAWLLQSFFRYPQGFLMLLMVGLIAPSLISQDIRSRAFLLYFSRPLTRGEYILGKISTVWFYLAVISTLPALALYFLGILLSPRLDVVVATWDLPVRILAASAVLSIPTAALALCLSAMTQESRYAGFAWFAIWILGWTTYGIMTSVEAVQQTAAVAAQSGFDMAGSWANFSLYHALGRVQSWIFGFLDFHDVWASALILVVVSVVSVVVLFRRVAAPMRV